MDSSPAHASLTERLREALRSLIVEGGLEPGARLPTEAELGEQHRVSRVTVRRALAELNAAGLIEKVNGRGSFVRRPRPPGDLGPVTGFLEFMRRRGHRAIGVASAPKTVRATPPIAAALGVSVGSPIGAIGILHRVDDEPHAHQTAYGSVGLVERLAKEDLATNDLMTLMNQRLGHPVRRWHTEIEAAAADAALARRLKVPAGAPVLSLHVTGFDEHGTPVLYNDFRARGDRFRFKVDTTAS
jgi:GntR family transcriptional regulator